MRPAQRAATGRPCCTGCERQVLHPLHSSSRWLRPPGRACRRWARAGSAAPRVHPPLLPLPAVPCPQPTVGIPHLRGARTLAMQAFPAALPVGALSADWSTAPRLRREPEAPSPPQPHVRSADIVAFGGLQRFWRAAVGCQHTIALLSRGGCCARVPSMGGCSPSACSRLQALTPGLACACPAAVSWQAFDRMRACRGRTPTSCGREPPSACCWYQCSAACPK